VDKRLRRDPHIRKGRVHVLAEINERAPLAGDDHPEGKRRIENRNVDLARFQRRNQRQRAQRYPLDLQARAFRRPAPRAVGGAAPPAFSAAQSAWKSGVAPCAVTPTCSPATSANVRNDELAITTMCQPAGLADPMPTTFSLMPFFTASATSGGKKLMMSAAPAASASCAAGPPR